MAAITPDQVQYMQSHASDDERVTLYATCALIAILPIMFVALRFVARKRHHAPLRLDDWLNFSALVYVQLRFWSAGLTLFSSLW